MFSRPQSEISVVFVANGKYSKGLRTSGDVTPAVADFRDLGEVGDLSTPRGSTVPPTLAPTLARHSIFEDRVAEDLLHDLRRWREPLRLSSGV